jgi:hypothetical protein
MRRFFLLSLPVLAIAACAPQQPPPPPAAAASPSNTTTFYDGSYDGSFAQNMSAGMPPSVCPNLRVAPHLTIQNGVARFAALDLNFQGYVTPQGEVRMQAPTGQTFEGQIDPYYVLRGRTTGTCVYDATWKRTGGAGPKTS